MKALGLYAKHITTVSRLKSLSPFKNCNEIRSSLVNTNLTSLHTRAAGTEDYFKKQRCSNNTFCKVSYKKEVTSIKTIVYILQNITTVEEKKVQLVTF